MRDLLISKASGVGRSDMSAAFGVDWARRIVRRAEDPRLRVNPEELQLARAVLRAAADLPPVHRRAR